MTEGCTDQSGLLYYVYNFAALKFKILLLMCYRNDVYDNNTSKS